MPEVRSTQMVREGSPSEPGSASKLPFNTTRATTSSWPFLRAGTQHLRGRCLRRLLEHVHSGRRRRRGRFADDGFRNCDTSHDLGVRKRFVQASDRHFID